MAVPIPGPSGAVRNTVGGAYTKQNISGVSIGVTNSSNVHTRSFSIMERLNENEYDRRDGLPREGVNAISPSEHGEFAYNAALHKTYIASRLSTKIGGVENSTLLNMGQAKLRNSQQLYARENMFDLMNGDADEIAFDKAASFSRTNPGSYTVLIDFTDSDIATSGNYLDLKPITYA